MNISSHTGFSSPVFDSQRAFRSVMNAMARPGSFHEILVDVTPPDGLSSAAAACLLALCDFETSLWVSPRLETAAAIQDYLVFHTGAKRAQNASDAQFALLDIVSHGFQCADFSPGTAEYPDRSTTIVALTPSLTGGTLRHIKGPGIQNVSLFAVEALPANFVEQWAVNQIGFPLGVDMVFCAGHNLLALPRSTRIVDGF